MPGSDKKNDKDKIRIRYKKRGCPKSQKSLSFRGETTKESTDYQIKKINFVELAFHAAVPSLPACRQARRSE